MALRPPSLLLIVLVALTLGACATPSEPAPETAAIPALERVVVAPLNVTVRPPAELEGKGEPVWQALLGYLQERDRQVAVLSPISAELLWRQATSGLDLSDRQSALRTGTSRFAQQLARNRDFDVLVVPSLVLRPAHLSGTYAAWDGVRRIVPNAALLMDSGMAQATRSGELLSSRLRGKVAAVSLHVSVLRPDGSTVHEGVGGLDVLQEARRENRHESRLSLATRSEPFADPGSLREGVSLAFEGPLLAAAAAP